MTQRVRVVPFMREEAAALRSWDGRASLAEWAHDWCEMMRGLGFRYFCTAGWAKSSRWASWGEDTPIFYLTHTTQTFGQYNSLIDSGTSAWRGTVARIADSTHLYLKLDSQVSFNAIVRNVDAHVAKDFGSGYFEEFSHDFEFRWDSASQQYGEALLWGVTDSPAGMALMTEGFGVNCFDNNNAPYLRIWEFAGDTYSTQINISSDTLYYCTVSRSGSTCTLSVYTDPARTSLLATRTLAVGTDAKRCLIAFASAGSSWNGTHTATGWVRAHDVGAGELDLRLFDVTDPNGNLTTLPEIAIGQTFTNGSVSADVASPGAAQQSWAGSGTWNDTLKDIMAAAAATGMGCYVHTQGWFEGGFCGWNGMHLWHDWNTGLNHWDNITWEGNQHADEAFFDELMAYGDAFAGVIVEEIWRWREGMSDFFAAMQAYTGRGMIVPCTINPWWFNSEFNPDFGPRPTSCPEIYGYHLGGPEFSRYQTEVDAMVAREFWTADQGVCLQGPEWTAKLGNYGGQVDAQRLACCHEAGVRGVFLIYDEAENAPADWQVTAFPLEAI